MKSQQSKPVRLKFSVMICSILMAPLLTGAAKYSQAAAVGYIRYHLSLADSSKTHQDTTIALRDIKMSCNDSSTADHINHWIILYGKAKIIYKNISVEGDRIMIDEYSKQIRAISNAGRPVKNAVYLVDDKVQKTASTLVVNLHTRECQIIKP